MDEKEIAAQNELSLSFFNQAMHKSRIFLFPLAVLLYMVFKSVVVIVLYVAAILLFMRLAPVKVKDKEGLFPYLAYEWAKRQWKKLRKKLVYLLALAMNLCFPLVVFSQEIPPPPSQSPPPPPPPPEGTPPSGPQVIEKGINEMSAKELEAFLRRQEIQRRLLDRDYFLRYGGTKELYLRHDNYFVYSPLMPLLFVFDKKVRRVLLASVEGVSIVYEDNYIFLVPPPETSPKVLGFVVTFEDGSVAYFAGERISPMEGSDLFRQDDRLRKFLESGGKKSVDLRATPGRVVLVYRFRTPEKIDIRQVVEYYLKSVKRCPQDGDTFTLQGMTYRVNKRTEKFMLEENEFYACGSVFAVIPVR